MMDTDLSDVDTDAPASVARPPAFGRRVLLYLATWAVALLMLFGGEMRMVLFLPWFPVGLLPLLRLQLGDGTLFMGWMIYLVHALCYFLASTRWRYWAAYSVLVVLLLTNVSGCQAMLTEFKSVT